jgi:hypothetical protein
MAGRKIPCPIPIICLYHLHLMKAAAIGTEAPLSNTIDHSHHGKVDEKMENDGRKIKWKEKECGLRIAE